MEDGLCTVPPNAPYILLVNWMQENETWTDKKLNRLLNIKKTIYTADNGIKLPVDLGDGMAAKVRSSHPNQPYEMAAKFRCGGKERYFSFAFAEFAKGRDSFKDMTELMRIAQKRYAALHKCELGQ